MFIRFYKHYQNGIILSDDLTGIEIKRCIEAVEIIEARVAENEKEKQAQADRFAKRKGSTGRNM